MKNIIEEFVKGTPIWHKSFRNIIDTSKPCAICGMIPDNMLELSEAISDERSVPQ